MPNLVPATELSGTSGHGKATTSAATSRVEDLLEDVTVRGPCVAGALGHPEHAGGELGAVQLAGDSADGQQRESAIRHWLRLETTEAIPGVGALEILFGARLDALDPYLREMTMASFLAIARGRESMDSLFLTYSADYAVTNILLGSGGTPTRVTGLSLASGA